MAPNTATPTALPNERKNMFEPVTPPRCCQPTLDCAAISDGVALSPMPIPITKQNTPTSATGDPGPSNSSSAAPIVTTTAPITLHNRKPIRRYTFPACDPAIGQPIVSVA